MSFIPVVARIRMIFAALGLKIDLAAGWVTAAGCVALQRPMPPAVRSKNSNSCRSTAGAARQRSREAKRSKTDGGHQRGVKNEREHFQSTNFPIISEQSCKNNVDT